MAKYRKDSEAFDLDSVGTRHPIATGTLSLQRGHRLGGLLGHPLAHRGLPIKAALRPSPDSGNWARDSLLQAAPRHALEGHSLRGHGVGGRPRGRFRRQLGSGSPRRRPLRALGRDLGDRRHATSPNDWSDIEEDVNLGVRTLPIRFGRACVDAPFGLDRRGHGPLRPGLSRWSPRSGTRSSTLPWLSLSGLFLLVLPGLRWLREQSTESAMAYFNKACFYPLAVFAGLGGVGIMQALGKPIQHPASLLERRARVSVEVLDPGGGQHVGPEGRHAPGRAVGHRGIAKSLERR